ncbi:GIGYF family protein [Lucilia cuprina]|nr:GIGYF family protein [Lucilia cuprina]
MTDSMKFGPEWLRNMSADTTSSNTNTSGQINPAGVFGSGNSGGGGIEGSAVNNSNSGTSNLNPSSLHNNVNAANTAASRNTFPEFRYGREEMLLLFDRNCGIPEILPSYKNLFVERVQFPLALVPSTDEDMLQGSAPPTQRPGWLQRSPVGFSTATRGTGRVGCMERGRMRGKSIYHPVFQRPNAMFDDDQRSSTIKTDRSWVERNGGASAADPAVTGPSTIVGGGLGTDAWNGNTPVSSPRREFSNHPRNMENWRRSRNEDGSGGESSSAATFSADGGWRMNTSGFQNSHTRWGRSTSWRDDELANNNENSGIVGSSGATIAGAGGVMMMRSNSTISTTQSERIVQSSVSGKQTGAPGVTRSMSVTSSGSRNTVSGNIWPNSTTVGQMNNCQGDGSGNDEMGLPEWAMENPSDIGGTFDASGAFHGAIDDDIHARNIPEEQNENDSPEQNKEDKKSSDTEVQEKLSKTSDDNSNISTKSHNSSSMKETENYQDSSSASPTPPLSVNQESNDNSSVNDKSKQNPSSCTRNQVSPTDVAQENVFQKNIENHSENEYNTKESDNSVTSNNAGDYAERMMKVTDDMIEKLIMDDEDTKEDHMKASMLSGGNKRNTQPVFVSALQQPQNSNHPTTVSPALGGGSGPTCPPNMSLYNMGGIMVDHTHNIAALHQLQQQQMAAVAAAAIGLQSTPPPPHPMTSSAPTDLWLYRDPQAKVQGPFSALEMTEWYRAGYFNENLYVRRVCDVRFRPLGDLIKICNGQMPFSHSHLIPIDLNTTPLTPPLAPVIPAQSSTQAADFVIKTLNEQQQHEKLKGNVTAAADSLSNALKSLINSVDISQVLNMHFQTLQDRFIHNQEIEIANELSKNECFRRLSPAEQDAVVRQKLQMMVLPEYLTSLTGLSNSLAALNPTAGTQLYDTIAECTKKEQLFSNHQSQPQSQTPVQQQQQQQQQRGNHHASSGTPYINAEDFIMKTKNTGHELNSNDLLNEFNLRMFLNNGTDSGSGGSGGVAASNSHGHEFLSDQQLFGAGATPTQNPPNNVTQSPMMQMWMNSLASNQTNHLPNQHPLMTSPQQAAGVNNQWLNGPLVGIPTLNLSREQHGGINIMGSPKPTPASMWDVATLEQQVQVQRQHEQQQLHQQMQQQSFDHQRLVKDAGKHLQDQQQQNIDNNNKQQQHSEDNKQEQQQMSENEVQKSLDAMAKVSSLNDNGKQEPHQRQAPLQPSINEKSQSQNNNNKRNSTNNNNNVLKSSNKPKSENVDQISKKTDDERRREINEEKRRQKEERKRLQMEEEKRRLMQAEDEKRRQMQEEEKRQQQIQAQRRKALMSSNNSSSNNNANNSLLSSANSANNLGSQKSKEQQRIQSSVAPWSTQTLATKSQGPGLAEIQKAEIRERRADQQRQLEIQEKQMRANETQDTVLKWNAAPVPVKSFAEIQAEEARRLAHEQMELQRRKEQEAHNNLIAFNSAGTTAAGGLNSSSNISSIWSGNKIWGTSTNTTGFWEDPLKFNNKSMTSGLSNNNVNNNSNVTGASIISQSSNLQQKQTTSQQQHQQQPSSSQQSLNKNVKKSPGLAVGQNTVSPPTSSSLGGPTPQRKPSNNTAPATKQVKPQKADNNSSVSGNNENKKSSAKNSNNANKIDDYEAEFTNWCTKSLNNMNTKVDVPTFVSFLRDLESPYEVKDYIRMYLGESKEYIDFAKQFLERRSKYKNLQRAQNAHDDDLCKPAQAITPSVNDNSENKGKQKKVKKNKMTKLDARNLGFSVTAAEGRINVGDRDYVDAP